MHSVTTQHRQLSNFLVQLELLVTYWKAKSSVRSVMMIRVDWSSILQFQWSNCTDKWSAKTRCQDTEMIYLALIPISHLWTLNLERNLMHVFAIKSQPPQGLQIVLIYTSCIKTSQAFWSLASCKSVQIPKVKELGYGIRLYKLELLIKYRTACVNILLLIRTFKSGHSYPRHRITLVL